MAYAPTLTGYTDAAPCPRVLVDFTSLAATTALVDVYRLSEGRTWRVRSAVKAAAAGSFQRLDFEVPFGVQATYRAEMFNASEVSLGFTDSTNITLNVADAWMHNPLDPSGALLVDLDFTSAKTIVRPTPGEVFYPEGRTVGVLISGQRRGIVGVELMVSTDVEADAVTLDSMFGNYDTRGLPIMCLRTPPYIRLPRTFMAAILEPGQRPLNVHMGGALTEWDLKADEISPPAPGLIVPLLTRADINAFYATRAAVRADNLTRGAVNRRYDLAGTA